MIKDYWWFQIKNKGQIFSTDLLIAMILIIFCVGFLIGYSELKIIEAKERTDWKIMKEHTEAAAIVLVSGIVSNTYLENNKSPFSIRTNDKEYIYSGTTLKRIRLGLLNYNVFLKSENTKRPAILNEPLQENIVSLDLNTIGFATSNVWGSTLISQLEGTQSKYIKINTPIKLMVSR